MSQFTEVMAQAAVDFHINIQDLVLLDQALDVNVRKSIVKYCDEIYLKHLLDLCQSSEEKLGGKTLVEIFNLRLQELKSDKETPPQINYFEVLREVLLQKSRFNSFLPRIIFELVTKSPNTSGTSEDHSQNDEQPKRKRKKPTKIQNLCSDSEGKTPGTPGVGSCELKPNTTIS